MSQQIQALYTKRLEYGIYSTYYVLVINGVIKIYWILL